MNYSKAIRVARSLCDVSQKTLAERMQVDPSLISLIESEKRTPSLATAEKVAGALGMPLHLFVLLASEEDDLAGVGQAHVDELGKALTRILFSSGSGKVADATRARRGKAKYPHPK